MSDKVAIDTHILIWGVEKNARPSQQNKIQLADSLINRLDEHEVTTLVPSIVAAEFLRGIDETDHAIAYRILEEHFMIAAHDLLLADRTAQVARETRENGLEDQLLDKANLTRQELKVDYHIVGSVLSHEVVVFYCEDGPLSQIADGYVEVRDMPAKQKELQLQD